MKNICSEIKVPINGYVFNLWKKEPNSSVLDYDYSEDRSFPSTLMYTISISDKITGNEAVHITVDESCISDIKSSINELEKENINTEYEKHLPIGIKDSIKVQLPPSIPHNGISDKQEVCLSLLGNKKLFLGVMNGKNTQFGIQMKTQEAQSLYAALSELLN